MSTEQNNSSNAKTECKCNGASLSKKVKDLQNEVDVLKRKIRTLERALKK